MAGLRLVLDVGPAAAAAAREAAAALVRSTWSGLDDLADDVRQVTGELVGNAVRHGAPPVALEVEAAMVGTRHRVTVTCRDAGAWRDAGAGRGLALVRALCDRLDVESGDTGTDVTATLHR